MNKTVRFYFSFRSPYSWLATFRIYHLEDKLPVSFDLVPVFPPKDYKNDPETQLNKKDYIRNDVKRIANAYGLNVCFPNPFDTNWVRPHSAFLYAND